jgi:hypothetical protein
MGPEIRVSSGAGRPEALERLRDRPRRFEFAFAPGYRRVARLFGVTPARAWVAIDGAVFEARFGPWRVLTPLANIVAAGVTGPYRPLKTAGPARLAITDRGLTFATNRDRGVRITFATPVAGLDPLGLVRHPELTVTVADVEGLTRLLDARPWEETVAMR